jgi:hypothetical protein
MHPAIDESAAGVVGKRAGLAFAATDGTGEQIGFHQDLKAITDADDRFSGFNEQPQRLGQMMSHLIGQNSTGGDIVAVTETAGDGQELILLKQRRILEQAIYVNQIRGGPGLFEGKDGLAIAVDSRRP